MIRLRLLAGQIRGILACFAEDAKLGFGFGTPSPEGTSEGWRSAARILTYANAHFGSSIEHFYLSESQLGRPNHYIEGMATKQPPEVRKGLLTVPTGPGLGLEINPDFLRQNLVAGEPFWG
ncbi:MAG TPA: enolase C-terminal domain-like protein [Bryobacteraceae bacterium]|nr:enolase C-terminal domain-like protein [Bryobacteraceae bacterium]